MKQFLSLFFILPTLITAQITIDQSDMPMAGDILTFSNSNDLTIDPTITGENYVWDFTNLVSFAQDADTFVTVGSTPFLYQFFFNNGFLYPDYEADVALNVEDINVVVVSATEVYNYYKNDDEGYRLVGIGANVSGIPTSTQYDPIDWIYEFPLNFGDEFEGESFIEFSLPGIGYVSQDKETVTEVDGWGTLQLPIGDYNVLRLKRTIAEQDSVYNEAVMFGFNVDQPEAINYQWLAEGEGQPILEMNLIGGQLTSIRYKDDLIIDGIGEFIKRAFDLYPNPSSDYINIASDVFIQANDLLVIDNLGRVVNCPMERHESGIKINVMDLEQGLYHLQMKGADGIQSKPFLIY